MKKIVLIILVIVVIIFAIFIINKNKDSNYELKEVVEYNYYQLNKEQKLGVINTKGEIIVEPIYDSIKIPNPEKDVFICQKDNTYETLNSNAQKLFNEYEEVDAIELNGIVSDVPYEKEVLKYKKNGKYGIISYDGKQLTKPIYDEIQGLNNKEGEMLVKKDDKYGVINCKGKLIIKTKYDSISGDGFYTKKDKYKYSGYIVNVKTQDGYRYGYINNKLKKILDEEYSEIYRIMENDDIENTYIIATKKGMTGVIKNNNQLIDAIYQDIEFEKNNKIFIVKKNSQYGVLDINGNIIVPIDADSIQENGIYILEKKNNEQKYYDLSGNIINDLKYEAVNKTKSDKYFIASTTNGKYGVIDNNKNELIEANYTYMEYLFDDYFIATKDDGDLGIINSKNRTIVEFKYDVIQKIGDTKIVQAKTINKDKSDFYSSSLSLIASLNNANVTQKEDVIKISNNEDVRYFDAQGNELQKEKIFVNNKLLSIKEANKWGFVDKSNKNIVECKYDKVTEFNQYGFAGVCIDEKWGVINENGEILIQPTYKLVSDREPEFIGEYYKVYYGYGESYYTDKK